MKNCSFIYALFCIALQTPLTLYSNTNTAKSNQSIRKQTAPQLYYFGTDTAAQKGTAISNALCYNHANGYGFDFHTASNVRINSNHFSVNKSAYFSAAVPEGNYQIEVKMGNAKKNSNVTIKAESRRLMLNQFVLKKGKTVTKIFNVNVRNIKIDGNTNISLKDRDKGILNWDDKLTLEFLGDVSIQSIKITPVDNLTTVYLAGDSTVTDQDLEPWGSWGQFITNYFDDTVVVANYAYSGAALSSFKASGRLKKILSLIKEGDYLFVEFGHNDEKIKSPGNGPWESYSSLLTEFVQSAKEKGAIPILVTPTQRRSFNENGTLKETHGEFPDAMRAVAKKNNIALIDIAKITTELYEAWGDDASRKAFVQYPANTFPGQEKALDDNTHFNSFGANEIALCILKGIHELALPLGDQILRVTPAYNPKKPNNISSWTLPMSDRFEVVKPDGS